MKRFQKQFLALCISVSLCSTALAGCGNSSEEAVAQTEATTEAQEATETTQEETTQEAEEAVKDEEGWLNLEELKALMGE